MYYLKYGYGTISEEYPFKNKQGFKYFFFYCHVFKFDTLKCLIVQPFWLHNLSCSLIFKGKKKWQQQSKHSGKQESNEHAKQRALIKELLKSFLILDITKLWPSELRKQIRIIVSNLHQHKLHYRPALPRCEATA